MKILILIILFILLELLNAHKKLHRCNHDNEFSANIPNNYIEEFEQNYGDRRLQSSSPQQIRVTYDDSQLYNNTNGAGMTDSKRSYIQQLVKVAQLFLKNFIKVVPRTTPIKSKYYDTCGSSPFIVYYPAQLLPSGTGITNSDLHLIVTYFNDPNSGQLATAGFCELDPGPIIGRVRFNLGTMNMTADDRLFQDNFSVSLHELTHVLGFSGSSIIYWIDPDTGKPYGANTLSKIISTTTLWGITGVTKLFSKNVLKTTQNHFACPMIDGMFLENQGGSGSMGSHWERDLVKNEYMTASQVHEITEFTAALLRDTGYYAEINSNMINPLFWGKNKGCDFFYNVCNSTIANYPEFPVSDLNKKRCDFYQVGQGIVSNTSDSFSQCPIGQNYSNLFCSDSNYLPSEWDRQNTGQNSYCFYSSALQTGWTTTSLDYVQRCHKIECNSDQTSIKVYFWLSEFVTCNSPGQEINLATASSSTYGTLKCPFDFKMMCTFPKKCKNSCSSNGICSNGNCICLDGYAGEDCSVQCASPNVYDGINCVNLCPANTFKNSDNTCKSTCPTGYYQDTQNQICSLCHTFCSACTGSLSTQCQACNSGYELKSTSCNLYSCDSTCGTCSGSGPNKCTSCVDSKYLDSNYSCQACPVSCTKCTSFNICTGCKTNYTLDSSTQSCQPVCDASCKSCSLPLNANACTDCKDGTYLSSNQCLACSSACTKCSTSSINCQGCSPGYILNGSTCNPTCHPSCKTCTAMNDPNACSSCNNGYYQNSTQCIACIAPCLTCVLSNSKVVCTSCTPSTDYTYDSVNQKCNPICHSSCTSCTQPNNSNQCNSCSSGFYLSNTSCLACQTPCKTCLNSATSCRSCINTTDYIYDNINYVCNLVCHSSCKTCTNPNDQNSCTKCADGYYLDVTTCKACISPCKYCSSSNQCLSCINTTDYNFNSTNKTCDFLCHSSCKTCTKPNDSNSCSSCVDGYYQSLTQCLKCNSPCSKCTTNADKCTQCVTGYTYDSSLNKCNIQCFSTCKTCTIPNNNLGCNSCIDGYYISNNQCLQCQSPCATCNNLSTTCQSCVTNYTYDSTNNKCNPICDNSCKFCILPKDPNSCSSCNAGYFLNSYSQCVQCQSPCQTCTQQATKCLSCLNNTDYTYDNVNNKCNFICHITCKSCTAPNNNTQCQSCNDGYYLGGTTCKQCTNPCSKCIGQSTQCTDCVVNYKLNTINQCIPSCDQSCATCSKPQDSSACLSCNIGYVKMNTSCLQCTLPCSECQNSQTQCTKCVASHILNGTVCEPTCNETCKSCSKFIDENSCTSCFDGFYLNGLNVGKCAKCQSLCETCKNGNICDTCIGGYLLNQNGMCEPICDASCLTCSKPSDKNACLSCSPPLVLNSSTCKQCDDGKYYLNEECAACIQNCKQCQNNSDCIQCNDGYELDNTKQCKKKNTCHFTCKDCINNSFNTCISCVEDRVLNKLDSSSAFGVCECPDNTTDYNQSYCSKSNVQSNIKQTITSTFLGSATASSIVSIASQNPLVALSLFQFSQSISYLAYVNHKQPVGFDSIMKVLTYSNFDFGIKSSTSSKRILQDINNHNADEGVVDMENENAKMRLNNKSNNFLWNTMIILILQGLSWFISLMMYLSMKYFKSINQKEFFLKAKKILFLSSSLLIYELCSQEMWLCIFYQFQLHSNDNSDTSQFVCSVFAFIYMVSVLFYLFYQIEYKKCIKSQFTNSPQQTVDLAQTSIIIPSDQYLEDYEKFYLISQFIKQDSFMTRNFFQFIVLQKMIISAVSSCVSSNPQAQIIIMILTYSAVAVYLCIFRPLLLKKHTLVLILIYFIITVINILYSISISYEDDAEASKSIALTILIILIIFFTFFFSYSLVVLLQFLYLSLKNCIYRDLKKLPSTQPEIKSLQMINQKQNSLLQIPQNENTLFHIDNKSVQYSQNQLFSARNNNQYPNLNSLNNVKVL